jgi:Flp pilus assembly protein TadD
MVDVTVLEKILASGQDNALLRFTLGSNYLRANDFEKAVIHLARAVELDPDYSAAWKNYARTLEQAGRINEAIRAYTKGIQVAENKRDKQAQKEMSVFLKRLQKNVRGEE